MLSFEHVRARREGNQLVLLELSSKQRVRALALAGELLAVVAGKLGASRDEIDDALAAVELRPSERRLAEGLKKLIEDGSEFEQVEGPEPAVLRSELFLRAAARRKAATLEAPFAREQVLAEHAAELETTASVIEAALYADLRGAQRLRQAPIADGPGLVEEYERAQVQALLLRAVNVAAVVRCANPDGYRALFQKLKFRQLLYRLERLPGAGYRIVIDGPFSLFEAVTKYGLELALSLPALEACDVLELSADVLWGKQRTPLRFEHRHVTAGARGEAAPSLRDEVRTLLDDFTALDSTWRPSLSEEILELPGIGACVPDLTFVHAENGERIHVELLGYWSRDAVFRRVELVERGLAAPVVFAVSSRLRVSEAVLEEGAASALYVYRGKPSARSLEKKLDGLRTARRK